jgi:hypothetical protein
LLATPEWSNITYLAQTSVTGRKRSLALLSAQQKRTQQQQPFASAPPSPGGGGGGEQQRAPSPGGGGGGEQQHAPSPACKFPLPPQGLVELLGEDPGPSALFNNIHQVRTTWLSCRRWHEPASWLIV